LGKLEEYHQMKGTVSVETSGKIFDKTSNWVYPFIKEHVLSSLDIPLKKSGIKAVAER
jgi:hypothetical protein